jgi:hypothetical protein
MFKFIRDTRFISAPPGLVYATQKDIRQADCPLLNKINERFWGASPKNDEWLALIENNGLPLYCKKP